MGERLACLCRLFKTESNEKSFAAENARREMRAACAVTIDQVVRKHLNRTVSIQAYFPGLSRAVGPALAGPIIVAWDMASAFWLNALSAVGVVAARLLWRPCEGARLRRKPFGRAVRAACPHCGYNLRAAGFSILAIR